MMKSHTAEIVFFLTLIATFVAAYLGRRHSAEQTGEHLSDQKLNKWLIGLSAGATANSGFIVTGAVGLGYAYGYQWLLLPVAWLLGDLVFWHFFPSRINAVGRESGATTLSQFLTYNISDKLKIPLILITSIIILISLSGYTSAQWIAGQKFLSGAFELSGMTSLALFAAVIIAYTSIGGFRGSVYADSFQAVIRIIGTAVALGAVIWVAYADMDLFTANLNKSDAGFFNIIPGGTLTTAIGFMAGFAFAALGFGLGQPQVVTRYIAGASPEETKAAMWIYILFVQFTWIAMTLFGIVLKGVMPGISDPEAGVSIFFQSHFPAIITGIIVADVFATIAATSNSILVVMAQVIKHDFFEGVLGIEGKNIPLSLITILIGGVTMGLSLILAGSSVFSIALSAVSFMGAGLAAVVMVKAMKWNHSSVSLLTAVVVGLVSAVVWKQAGLGSLFNEAGVGILVGLTSNWIVCVVAPEKTLHAKAVS